jgi:acid phosphatase (class A)
MRHGLVFCGLLLSFLCFQSHATGEGAPFITAKDVDITYYLPAPPADNSPQTQAEIRELLDIQAKRTPEQAQAAIADAQESVWRFADVLGEHFTASNLPQVDAFFARIAATEAAVDDPAKKFWHRSRPYLVSGEVKPLVARSSSGSWPSGHAALGYTMAMLLADMVPEKRDALFARAAQYAENRLVVGVHYRSDTVMSRTAAALMVQKMHQLPEFTEQFQQTKTQLRTALGYH